MLVKYLLLTVSSEDNPVQDSEREEQIDILTDYAREISQNSERIERVFEDTFNSDETHNNYDDYLSTMELVLTGIVDEGDKQDVTSALVNLVINYDSELYDEIAESDDGLADLIKKIASEYGLSIQRRIQRINQGHDYWNNVKSELSVRSNYPKFNHELVIDYTYRMTFDSSFNGTALLAQHFLEQIAEAPDVLGEDTLTFVDRDAIEKIQEVSEEILEQMDEFEEPLDQPAESTGQSEGDETDLEEN